MAVAAKAAALRLPPLPTIRDLVRLYRLRAIKQLSQNFLMDERLTDKIVKAAGPLAGARVCEVGPGPGGITRSIMRCAPAQLLVVEKDPRFTASLDMLAESCQGSIDFKIIIGDILKTNLENLFSDAPKTPWDDKVSDVHLIGNLPFSISTILTIRWLEAISTRSGAWAYGRTKMTLTFQKEIAQRMAAPIMSPQRCRLSVMCQNWCHVNHKFDISGRAFVPKPDVDVGVVTLTPLKKPVIPLDFKLIERVLRHVFSMRQKYSIRGAQTLFPEDVRDTLGKEMYKLADIDPQTRPFELSNEEYGRLCHAYEDIITRHPEVADYDYRGPKNKKVESVEEDEADEKSL